MRKTTVYLPDALKRRLRDAALRRGKSEAELIGAAIERELAEEPPPRPRVLFHTDADPALARRVDEDLTGFGATRNATSQVASNLQPGAD